MECFYFIKTRLYLVYQHQLEGSTTSLYLFCRNTNPCQEHPFLRKHQLADSFCRNTNPCDENQSLSKHQLAYSFCRNTNPSIGTNLQFQTLIYQEKLSLPKHHPSTLYTSSNLYVLKHPLEGDHNIIEEEILKELKEELKKM
jgi:hypothetical protein